MKYDLSKSGEKEIAKGKFEKYLEQGKKIELKLFKERRSLDQNAYLHVCIGFVAQETGYTLEEAKIVLKREGGMIYEKNGQKFLRSTAELDTAQMTAFIDWIRNKASEDLAIYIPTPEEYMGAQFEIDKHLSAVMK